jgi:hypothetical protein
VGRTLPLDFFDTAALPKTWMSLTPQLCRKSGRAIGLLNLTRPVSRPKSVSSDGLISHSEARHDVCLGASSHERLDGVRNVCAGAGGRLSGRAPSPLSSHGYPARPQVMTGSRNASRLTAGTMRCDGLPIRRPTSSTRASRNISSHVVVVSV